MWKSIKDTGIQIVGKAVTVLISLVTTAILTRKLGLVNYGNFTLITSILLLVDAIADLGTRIIGVREISASSQNKKKIFMNMLWLRLLLSSIAFVFGLLIVFFYSGFEGLRVESLVALMMLWLTSWAGSLEMLLQSKLRLDWKSVVDVLFPLFFLIFLSFFKKIDLLIIFVLYLLARLLSLIIGWWNVRNWLDWYVKIDKKLIKRLFIQSWPMGLYLLLSSSYDKAVDSTMIKYFLGSKEVAWYSLAYKIYSSLIMPAYFFMSSIFPLLSGKNKKSNLFYKQGWLVLGVMLLIGSPLVYVLAPTVVSFLSNGQFYPSVMVLRILIFALIISYFNHLNGFYLISKGGQKKMLRIGIIGLLLNIVLNLKTIPLWGINGSAWTTVATEALTGLLMWKENKNLN